MIQKTFFSPVVTETWTTSSPSSTVSVQRPSRKPATRTGTTSSTWRPPTATSVSNGLPLPPSLPRRLLPPATTTRAPPPFFFFYYYGKHVPILGRAAPAELLDTILLPIVPPSLLSAQNRAGSTAL